MLDFTVPDSLRNLASPVPSAADYPGLDDWRELAADQQPTWRDHPDFAASIAELNAVPPLVFAGEVDKLRDRLAEVANGRAFFLQGGDCAETFEGATADRISARVKTLLQMAVVLTYGASMPVVKMGRMAGQFSKPRSSNDETRDGTTLPTFRGEMVNGFDFTEESRVHDPRRMVRGYHTSASTLNLIRAFTTGGFADLRLVHAWNMGFTTNPAHARYESLAREIDRAVKFMDACGADFDALRTTEFYAGHEALLLDYERALSRIDSRTHLPYGTSGHFLWIGERTRELDGAHVDLLSRLRNPIGVKLGPKTTGDDALALIDKLDPEREPGRLTFITRMGAKNIREKLPPLVEAVERSGAKVVWVTDPMHGNTVSLPSGYKTRNFDDVVDEVRGFFEVHEAIGSFPGGIHVEMTGDDVAECLGGADPVDESSFQDRYESLCDPRLNHMQSLEIAFLVAGYLSRR
ncbi:3-deoxy-7-phosphoheptulonate synthase class II [Kocuria rosea]|uniref:Phospho-2-dehydro-3-deoxyheptonate aldolase n=3 Tax=Micrococcaceae TaxID=1268 RepID=A0A0A6YD97_KOCRO|nr:MULTISPECIES: 3-deoxy-7-phosphoheptulonate synthase class II [Kocuria]MCC5784597.1 3-deoxy-7-phosphoheptulonate synthase class II [Kocuria sp. CCUG 69068]EYT50884.1 phospho-2-dehydro-3-deoxyheptonate aldolase [Kocuria sp. UCD-OTCP]KHD98807.1 phospho-2-dehydro-3-deoxyheptonate aldolase [Kocuria polaris]MCM3487159.1 3-deoxy-7-phosphoheptulonate synthase class II [Kocuria rosea]MEB2527888.1 3-deoxy-7-phosphoheptulonate synthase class II [Kocuria rosea]